MRTNLSQNPDRFFPSLPCGRYWLIVLTFIVLACCMMPADAWVTSVSNKGVMRGDFARIIQLSEIFAHGFGIATALTAVWLLAPTKRKFIPRLAVCGILPGLLAHGLKILIGRKRPVTFHGEFPQQFSETWLGMLPGPNAGLNLEYYTQSFPSAHAATAISFAICLAWVFPRGRFLFLGLASLAAFQRVVFEAHWMSDVLVGAAIGTMVGSAMIRNWGFGYWCSLFEKRSLNRDAQNKPQLAEFEEADEFRQSKAA